MKGRIVAIGGAEDKSQESVILGRVMALAPEGRREVAVITTASMIPDEVFPAYDEVFGELGAEAVHHLDVRDRAGARDPARVAAVERAGVVFMSGGDQLRLTNVLGASPLLAAMRRVRSEGAVIAGTSAGAAAMSATMIYNGHAADALRKGAVKMAAGLGFWEGVVIDSHFLERGRFTRLMEVGATNPEFVGIGLGEDAAVIVHDDGVLEAIGNGHVVVVDCAQLGYSNVADLTDGMPVATSHVLMHALTSGFGYDVAERRFLRAADLNDRLEAMRHADPGASGAPRPELL
ncbi:MAG: cyanophycinase [Paracoccaceae bacterium]